MQCHINFQPHSWHSHTTRDAFSFCLNHFPLDNVLNFYVAHSSTWKTFHWISHHRKILSLQIKHHDFYKCEMEHSLAPYIIQYKNIVRAARTSYLVQGWSGVWISAEPRDDPQNFQTWRPPSLPFNGNCVLFPEIRRPKREADQSRSSDEVEECGNTDTHPTCICLHRGDGTNLP